MEVAELVGHAYFLQCVQELQKMARNIILLKTIVFGMRKKITPLTSVAQTPATSGQKR